MKSLFAHRSGADPVWLAEELPGPGKPLTLEDRADCCPARPMVTVILPPTPGRPVSADLRLCGHHFRVSSATLRAADATIYDADGMLIEPSDDHRIPADHVTVPPPASPADRPSHAKRGWL